MTQQSREQVFTWGNKTWVHSQKDLRKEKKMFIVALFIIP